MTTDGRSLGRPGDGPPAFFHNYNIERILKTRAELRLALVTGFNHCTPRGEEFTRLVQTVLAFLPKEFTRDESRRSFVEDSLRHLAGRRMTPELADDTAWRIAGNVPRLKYRPVPPWQVQRIREWVPLAVTACWRRKVRQSLGSTYTFRVLAGSPCPRRVRKWLSQGMCRLLACGAGFEVRRHLREVRYPYQAPQQLVGFRLYGLVDPALCGRDPGFTFPLAVDGTGRVRLEQRVFPSGVRAWNRLQLRRTFRVDPGFTCPQGHPPSFPCHFCPVGYLECEAGKHKHNWTSGFCQRCQRADSWFDEELPSDVCVDCFNRDAYRNSKE